MYQYSNGVVINPLIYICRGNKVKPSRAKRVKETESDGVVTIDDDEDDGKNVR